MTGAMAKKTFSFKQENNYDQVDAIKVIKIMKSKSLKKHNNLPVKNIKKCSKAEKIQYQALFYKFSHQILEHVPCVFYRKYSVISTYSDYCVIVSHKQEIIISLIESLKNGPQK